MRSRRHDIRQMYETVVAILNQRDLMIRRMPARQDRPHSRHNLDITVDSLELLLRDCDDLGGRLVRRMEPFVARIFRDLELAFLHKYSRIRKRRLECP